MDRQCDTRRALSGFRTAVVVVAAAVTVGGTISGARAAKPAPAAPPRLRALLIAAHVPLAGGAPPAASSFPAAWTAFQRFARTGPDGELLFEFGVFESHFWGT